MEKYQQRQKTQQRQHQAAASTDSGHRCPKCGAAVDPDARFCEECGTPLSACECVSCGSVIEPGYAVCPHCGHPATSHCTFCGSEMSAGDAFCPECGNSRSGITCPECGTLNFRSFCRKCNHPLNPLALYAVEQAKADPRYQRACAIAGEIAGMEEEMAQLEALIAQEKARGAEPLLQENHVSDETRRLMEEFERLSCQSSPVMARPATPAPKEEAVARPAEFKIEAPTPQGDIQIGAPTPTRQFSDPEARLRELKARHAAMLEEFQREMDAMVPNPADPPEIQRNFACAHRVTIHTTSQVKEKVRVAWVCNKCHVFHANPSECCVAEFGGKWVTKEVTRTIETTAEGTVNL